MNRTLVTHSGSFHADDVFAAATLLMNPAFRDHIVIRTRSPETIKAADVVFDVGFQYDPATLRFDHHQANSPKAPDGKPYSAFGLVWKAFGMASVFETCPEASPEICATVANHLAGKFVRAIDLSDNGQGKPGHDSIGVVIGALNSFNTQDDALQDSAFQGAVFFATKILQGLIRREAKIEMDFAATMAQWNLWNANPSARNTGVFEIPGKLEWRRCVVAQNNLAIAKRRAPDALFVLQRQDDDQYGLTTTPVAVNSFISHNLIKEALRGQTPEIIESLTGIKGVTFCHSNGFYACGSREALLALAAHATPDARAQDALFEALLAERGDETSREQ